MTFDLNVILLSMDVKKAPKSKLVTEEAAEAGNKQEEVRMY